MNKKKNVITIISIISIVIVLLSIISFGFALHLLSDDKCIDEIPAEKKYDGYVVQVYNEEYELYHDISLENKDDIELFLSSTDEGNDYNLRKALFNSDKEENKQYLDYFKLSYVLTKFNSGAEIFKIDFLNREIEKVFNSGVDFSSDYVVNTYYDGFLINLICDDEICFAGYIMKNLDDYSYYRTKIINSNKSGDNTNYIVKDFFVDSTYSDDLEMNCDVYNEKDGELLIKDYCPNTYEELIEKVSPDKLNTYEITFDKDNRYVSGKKVS